MRAVICRTPGDAKVLSLSDVQRPELRAGQVRIRVGAFGINRADLLQRRGLYPPPPGESEILGLEVAGELVEAAPDVTSFKAGQRVMALIAGGGYAEEVTVDAGLVMPVPASLSDAEAAGVPEAFLTAHHNLFTLGGAKLGSRALIHAGASGVGTAGIQLLRAVSAETFVTVGSREKAAACEALGAMAIDYKSQSFETVVRERTQGKGVDIVLDPVGAQYLAANLKCTAVAGRIVLIGLMSGRETAFDMAPLLGKRISLIGSTLRNLPLDEKRSAVARFREQFLPQLATGEIKPIIDKIYPVEELAQAHERMEANLNIGKIIVSMGK